MHVGTRWQRKAIFFSEAPSLQLLNETALREFPGVAVNDILVVANEYNDGKSRGCDVVLVSKR